MNHMTVKSLRAKAKPDAQKCRGGRPAKLTATDERRLVRMVTKGEVDNAAQAARQLADIINKNVSVCSARCALKRAELKARSKKTATFGEAYRPAPCLWQEIPTLGRRGMEVRRLF